MKIFRLREGKAEKQLRSFLKCVGKMDEIQYCALCKILCTPLMDGKEPIPFDKTLEMNIDTFNSLPAVKRKEILGILKLGVQ